MVILKKQTMGFIIFFCLAGSFKLSDGRQAYLAKVLFIFYYY